MKKAPKGITFGNATAGRKPPQPVSLTLAADRVAVPFSVISNAMGALAAVIEEPCCVLGVRELELAVKAHRSLERAVGSRSAQDYAFRDGCAVLARDPATIIKAAAPVVESSNKANGGA